MSQIKDLSVERLKALGYDSLALIEQSRSNLSQINAELERRQLEESKVVKETTKKK